MITSITFQFQYNKNYLNKSLRTLGLYGERDTEDLLKSLQDDVKFLEKIEDLVAELNKDLLTCRIQEIIVEKFGVIPRITKKTKHKRTYFIGGLTIHEEDQIM